MLFTTPAIGLFIVTVISIVVVVVFSSSDDLHTHIAYSLKFNKRINLNIVKDFAGFFSSLVTFSFVPF